MPSVNDGGLFTEREMVSDPASSLTQEIREDPSLIWSIERLMEAEEDGQVRLHNLYNEIPTEHWRILCRTVLPEVSFQTVFPRGISYSAGATPFWNDVAQEALGSVEIRRWRVWLSVALWKANSKAIDIALFLGLVVSFALIIQGVSEPFPSTIDLGLFTKFINTVVFPAVSALANLNILIGIFGIIVTLILHERRDAISGDDLEEVHGQLQDDLQELRELIKSLQQETEE